MFKEIKSFIDNKEFQANIFSNKVNIVNYIDILVLESNRVCIKHDNGILN